MKRDIARFGTSDYPMDNAYDTFREQKSTDLMKDENNGMIMTEFLGLRANMYTVKDGKKDTKKAKRVKRNIVV